MPATMEEVLLDIQAQLSTKDVDKGIKKLNTSWSKGMKVVQKASEKSMTGTGKAVGKLFHVMGGAQKKYAPLMEAAQKAQAKLMASIVRSADIQKRATAGIEKHQKAIEALKAQQKNLAKNAEQDWEKGVAAADEDIKALEKKLELLKKVSAEHADPKLQQSREQAIAETEGAIKEFQAQFTFDKEALNEAAVEAGQELFSPFKAAIDKDLKGAFEGGARLLAKGIQVGVGRMGSGLMAKGAKMEAKGTAMKARGGGMNAVAGKGLEMLGGFMQKMGPMLKSLAQIGPLASVLATSVLAVVKMFIDAEAAAKEMNKEILASAGSAEFLGHNMGSVGAAAADLGSTLTHIRDAATSLDNLKWGISKAEHTATLNALSAEGVSLKRLEKEFKQVSGAAKDSAGYVKDWGTLTQMSVAYSRAFGVSLSELTQLQGEMMGEIGANITSVQASYQFMIQGAQQSGMAANKFFGIIRGSTADMDLFNNRMEESVKLLTLLGKTMTPRNAKQYMDTIKGYMKGMGLLDRLKSVLLAGGPKKVGAKAQKDHDRQLIGTLQDVENAVGKDGVGKLQGILKKNDPKEIIKWMAENDSKLTAGMREAIFKASRDQSKLTKGGAADIASSLKDRSPQFIKEQLDDISKNMFHGKKMEELSGDQRIAIEGLVKMTDEQIDQVYNAAQAQELMQATLVEKVASGAHLTENELKQVANLQLKGNTKEEKAADLAKKSSDEVWNALSADQKKELQNSKKQIDYQEKTASFQSSAMDKLSVLVEWVMNQLYKVMLGIWEAVQGIWGGGDDLDKAQLEVARTGNKQLMELADKATSVEDLKGKIKGGDAAQEVARLLGPVGDAERARLTLAKDELETKRREAKSPEAKASFDAPLKAAEEARGAYEAKWQAAWTARTKAVEGAGTGGAGGVAMMAEAFSDFAKKYETDPAKIKAETDPAKIKAEQEKAVKSGTGEALAENPALKAGDPSQKSMSVYDFYADEAAITLMTQNEEMTGILFHTADTLDEILRVLRFKGIKVAEIGNEKAPDAIQNAVLEAARTALIEFYMYQGEDKQAISDVITRGVKPGMIGAGLLKAAKGEMDEKGEAIKVHGKVGADAIGGLHADGGLVTGVREGIALVAKGEAIVPAGGGLKGGGGQTITIEFQGDAKKLIRAIASDTYYENKGKEKFR